MAGGWSANALAELVGVPQSSVVRWMQAGLVRAERQGRGCKGHSIGYAGLLELITVARLRQFGFSLQAIRKSVEELRRLSGEARPLTTLTLVAEGDDLVWVRDAVAISTLRKPGQTVLLIPVGEQAADLLRRLGYVEPQETAEGAAPAAGPAIREAVKHSLLQSADF